MVGKLVRCKYTDQVGIVLHKEITRRGNFRYHVFIGGEIESIPQNFLEVINAER